MQTRRGFSPKMFKVLLGILLAASCVFGQKKPSPPKSVRLYIFDCGTIAGLSMDLFDLKPEEIKGPQDVVTMCYLVVHPQGTLLWDAGQIPDAQFPPTGPAKDGVMTATKKLVPQLAEIGYKPEDITYFAMSHYHSDHTGNANVFAGSTWIVQEADRTVMFSGKPPGITAPATYTKLKDAKTILLKNEDKDVFGDGSVVIKTAPGHTPGHQMLFLQLKETGPLLLAGDLYHYPEERTLDRVPTFDADREMTRRTRKDVEAFLKKTGAKLIIQHDVPTHQTLNKSPKYYE
ncbi:MAG: N-acyl homoserine lactonase family protein [Acidobacteriota bacterium]